jgi:hypothetical protein
MEQMMTDVDLNEQLQAVAAQVLTPDQLTAFTAVADAQKFAGENGDIDAEKVIGQLRTVFRISDTRTYNWGQSSGQPAGKNGGDDARAELEKRHGVKVSPPVAPKQGADHAHAELEKRHGVKQQHT